MTNLSTIQYDNQQIRAVFERRDISEETIDEYSRLLQGFLVFISGREIHRGTLIEYKRHLKSRADIGTAYKAKKLTAATIFLQELFGKDKMQVKNFSLASGHKKDGITSGEMKIIIGHLGNLDVSKETVRLKALVALMYFQGLREVEIHRLDVEDIDLVQETAMVQGKGEDDKEMVFLNPECVEELKVYFTFTGIKSGAVFTSFSTNDSTNRRLSTRSIRKEVSDLLIECGVKKTPHGFRHYFTTLVLDATDGDVRKTMKLTRHKKVETVMIYDDRRLTKEDLPVVFNGFGSL